MGILRTLLGARDHAHHYLWERERDALLRHTTDWAGTGGRSMPPFSPRIEPIDKPATTVALAISAAREVHGRAPT